MSIAITWCNGRPVASSNSIALSIAAVSLPPAVMIGKSFAKSSPNSVDVMASWRAVIQLMLPRSVLISPLWTMCRYGWASFHDPNVLVLNREWTKANALISSGSPRSR